jgi:hypothetical protein
MLTEMIPYVTIIAGVIPCVAAIIVAIYVSRALHRVDCIWETVQRIELMIEDEDNLEDDAGEDEDENRPE